MLWRSRTPYSRLLLASQRESHFAIHRYLSFVIARLVPGNPVIKPFGVAELICGEAAGLCLAKPDAKKSHATRDRYLTGFPPSARMTAGRAVLKHRWKGTQRAMNQ
ncbi:hypothetical protein [Candidatus Spongiihabitans sp.]|uniref:hypothetical protein n=1 Tax=Candidatus Spongiihabitans sp. TaxID=3101308 RepID=UPI003C7D3820